MDSKILKELIELKRKFKQIDSILTNKVTPLATKISEKVDLDTYEYTEEEQKIVNEIEEISDDISKTFDNFYK
jgi:hypothetical protein